MKTLNQIIEKRLCIGCGACEPACPSGAIELRDFPDEGIRPVVHPERCRDCRDCVAVCPGAEVKFPAASARGPFGVNAEKVWGPLLEIWEGHAVDETIRFRGASGGALTALAAYCLETADMEGVLHIGQDPDDPVRNRTRLSRNPDHLMEAVGSRYAPASVGNGLGLVKDAERPCAIIGKPSEIAGIRKVMDQDAALGGKVGVLMSFFCAETPPTRATTDLVENMGYDSKKLSSLRYRGEGWPGHFAPIAEGEDEPRAKQTYQESWAFLQSYRPWATHIWPDGTGELADISCGDPWYEEPDGENPGFSLVVVRTERGREIVKGAMESGYLKLAPAELWKLENSQANLAKKKAAVGGRLAAMRLLGMPVPRFENAHLGHCWWRLSWSEKIKSTVGTVRRILQRGLKTPLVLDSEEGVPVKVAFDCGTQGKAKGQPER